MVKNSSNASSDAPLLAGSFLTLPFMPANASHIADLYRRQKAHTGQRLHVAPLDARTGLWETGAWLLQAREHQTVAGRRRATDASNTHAVITP